jgi:hypothetical protein
MTITPAQVNVESQDGRTIILNKFESIGNFLAKSPQCLRNIPIDRALSLLLNDESYSITSHGEARMSFVYHVPNSHDIALEGTIMCRRRSNCDRFSFIASPGAGQVIRDRDVERYFGKEVGFPPDLKKNEIYLDQRGSRFIHLKKNKHRHDRGSCPTNIVVGEQSIGVRDIAFGSAKPLEN